MMNLMLPLCLALVGAGPAGKKPASSPSGQAAPSSGANSEAADTAPPTGGGTDTDAGAQPPSDADESSKDVTRYQFTGLDIDGELRTPALLQFLARIGGEFETLGIPHRSFMPELQATSSEDAL